MARKKYDLQVKPDDKETVTAKLRKEVSLRSYKEVVEYLELIVNAHRMDAIPKDILTAGVYAGSVILQAIKMAKEEGDYAEILPDNMQSGVLGISADRSEMVALLTAGSSAIQIRLLKKQQQQGRIITVDADAVEALNAVPVETARSITDKARELINMGKEMEEGGLFSDE